MQLQNGTFLTVEIEMFGWCENLTDTLLILSISICLKDTKRFDNVLTQRFTNTFRIIEKQLWILAMFREHLWKRKHRFKIT